MTPPPWEAPYTAYLLTAAVADQDSALADTIWKAQVKAAQADVLAALGAQVRQAAVSTARETGVADWQMDWTRLGARICEEALKTAGQLIQPDPGPWQLPECSHCCEKIAGGLIRLIIDFAEIRGVPGPVYAEMCRAAASRTADG